jgi:uncharacterized membrane protein
MGVAVNLHEPNKELMDIKIILLLVVTGIGILNTIYLSYNALAGKDVACYFFPDEWCKKVQYSPHSKTFGVKNPYLGFFMLVTILILTILYLQGSVPFWIIFAIITFGLLFSAYFSYVQRYILKAYCTWCVLSALVFLGLFIIAALIFFN